MTASGALAEQCCCGGPTPPPDPADCTWGISPSALSVDCNAQAGVFNVNVLTGSGCGWEASVTSGGAYLSINSGSSGSTSGGVGFSIESNGGSARTGEITVVTTIESNFGPIGTVIGVFEVTQGECGGFPAAGSGGGSPPDPDRGCSWSLSPSSSNYDCMPQNGYFNVGTQLGCDWVASVISGGSFISIFAGASGSDAGTVQFSLQGNAGATSRGGQIQVVTAVASNLGPAGTVIGLFSLTQASAEDCVAGGGGGGVPCNWDVSPNAWNVADPCSNETGSSEVVTGAGCSWDATVVEGGAWVVITSGSSGLSSGTIVYDMTANNTGLERFGKIEVRTGIPSDLGPAGTLIANINIIQAADTATCPALFQNPGYNIQIENYSDAFWTPQAVAAGLMESGVGLPAWDGLFIWDSACTWVVHSDYSIPKLDTLTPGQPPRWRISNTGDAPQPPCNITFSGASYQLFIFSVKADSTVSIVAQYFKLGCGSPYGTYTRVGGAFGPATINLIEA